MMNALSAATGDLVREIEETLRQKQQALREGQQALRETQQAIADAHRRREEARAAMRDVEDRASAMGVDLGADDDVVALLVAADTDGDGLVTERDVREAMGPVGDDVLDELCALLTRDVQGRIPLEAVRAFFAA